MARDRISPEHARAWIRAARDGALVVVGVFMLVWETAVEASPVVLLVGAGMGCLGLPYWLRQDERKNGHEG